MTLYNLVVHQPLGKSGNALVLESLDPAREYHQVASFTDIDKGIKDLANTVFGSDWANGPLDHPKNGQVAHRIISVAMAALVAGENYLGGAPRYSVGDENLHAFGKKLEELASETRNPKK